MSAVKRLRAIEDAGLSARVLSRMPLLYDAGADPGLDRPAYVRAASAICWIGDRLAVVQDDAHFVAFVNPADLRVEALPLPAGPGGLRQFDDLRGNKAAKLDLEACIAVRVNGADLLLAFGSGSTRARERIAVIDLQRGTAELRDASGLYAALRRCSDFAGSELNVEGAVVLDGVVRLFNRGNGAPHGDVVPIDATADLDWPALWRYLQDPVLHPVPELRNIVQYDLGRLDGIRLTFTDACRAGNRLLFTATAEDSPDATRDGWVAGSALGIIDGSDVRYTLLREQDGSLFRGKVEGIAPSRAAANQVYVVVDTDDPTAASELCVVEISSR